MSASPAPSLSGKPGDRRDGPSGSGLRPHRRGVPSGRSLPAPIRRPGRFPETPGPRKTGRAFGGAGGLGVPGPWTGGRPEGATFAPCGHRFHPRPEDRPRSADPCPGDRSLRGTSSLRAMPAAARRLILASQGHARTGPLRFFDPLPPHVGLSRLLRGGVEGARGRSAAYGPSRRRLPPASDPASGPIPGGSRRISREMPRIRPPCPDGRLDPGRPAVDSLALRGIPLGNGKDDPGSAGEFPGNTQAENARVGSRTKRPRAKRDPLGSGSRRHCSKPSGSLARLPCSPTFAPASTTVYTTANTTASTTARRGFCPRPFTAPHAAGCGDASHGAARRSPGAPALPSPSAPRP
jgi:hypothetical protein